MQKLFFLFGLGGIGTNLHSNNTKVNITYQIRVSQRHYIQGVPASLGPDHIRWPRELVDASFFRYHWAMNTPPWNFFWYSRYLRYLILKCFNWNAENMFLKNILMWGIEWWHKEVSMGYQSYLYVVPFLRYLILKCFNWNEKKEVLTKGTLIPWVPKNIFGWGI